MTIRLRLHQYATRLIPLPGLSRPARHDAPLRYHAIKSAGHWQLLCEYASGHSEAIATRETLLSDPLRATPAERLSVAWLAQQGHDDQRIVALREHLTACVNRALGTGSFFTLYASELESCLQDHRVDISADRRVGPATFQACAPGFCH